MKLLQTPNKRQSVIECAILVVIAAVLRFWYVGKTDLGFDESFSLYMALQSVPDLVKMLCEGNNPPLWELLLHYWVKLFGISETAIRSLSVIFSVLTVIPIYVVGEKYIHRFAGIAAALCYCCSTFSIYLSHDCRVYSLMGCCAAYSLWLFLSIIHEPKRYKFVLLTLVNLMLMYGHYLSIWIIVMEFLIALGIKPMRKKIGKSYLRHAAALVVCFIPMLPVLFTRFVDSGLNVLPWIEKSTSMEALYDFLWRMCNVPVTTVLAIVLLLSAFIMLILRIVKKQYVFGNTTIISLMWVIPLLVSFALSFFAGFFLDRYFYFLFPLFYLSVSAYCLYLFPKRKVLGISLMGCFALTMAVFCSPDSSTLRFSGYHADVKPLVHQLVEAKEKEHALVLLPESFEKQFTYYLDEGHKAFRTQSRPTLYLVYQDYLLKKGYYYNYNYQKADFGSHDKVVFLYYKDFPVNGLNDFMEKAGFRLEKEQYEHPYVVCLFTK